ncbi:MAG: hypothetical protein M1399_03915 [Actinobacteria bacterium]|nr:hypothetical protein [Actinomycetota bacterium]MCL5447537.1 hypothetical protein [Actinomycetota bacterium]
MTVFGLSAATSNISRSGIGETPRGTPVITPVSTEADSADTASLFALLKHWLPHGVFSCLVLAGLMDGSVE